MAPRPRGRDPLRRWTPRHRRRPGPTAEPPRCRATDPARPIRRDVCPLGVKVGGSGDDHLTVRSWSEARQDAAVGEILAVTAGAGSLGLAAYVPALLLAGPPGQRATLAWVAAASFLACAALALVAWHRPLPPSLVHPAVAAVVLIVAANAGLHLAIT
jgi:hypothetical protein